MVLDLLQCVTRGGGWYVIIEWPLTIITNLKESQVF